MQEIQREFIYLYCVTKKKPKEIGNQEVGAEIYSIYSNGLYAIVGKTNPSEFSKDNLEKNLSNINWIGKKAQQHERIVEKVMQDTAVIPFKLGVIFKKKENIEKLLKQHHIKFKKTLSKLKDKEEWGVKIYCNREISRSIIENEDSNVKKKNKEIALASKGRAYFLKINKEELIDNILNQVFFCCGQDSFETLKNQSFEAKANKLLSAEITPKKGPMILNAVFFVDKKKIGNFEAAVSSLKAKYTHKGFEFHCCGPWPPYNFCFLEDNVKNKGL